MVDDCTDAEVIQLLRAVYGLDCSCDTGVYDVSEYAEMARQVLKFSHARPKNLDEHTTLIVQVVSTLHYGEEWIETRYFQNKYLWVIAAARGLLASLIDVSAEHQPSPQSSTHPQ